MFIELPSIQGSWYKKILSRSKKAISSLELNSKLQEIEYGLEVNGVLKQQSEIDKNTSEALVNILQAIKDVPNAVIRIGSLLVVKMTDIQTAIPAIQVRTLTIREMYVLNQKPHLLKDPKSILEALANEIKGKFLDDGAGSDKN